MRQIIAALLVCLAWPALAQEPLVGSRWLAEDISGSRVIDRVQARLEVLAEGRIAGHSGCNSFTGAGVLSDGIVELGALATTRKACPPAIMNQEQAFLSALSKAASYETMSNGGLILRDSRGAALVRFTRM
jgi:heat shock protein HslJ